MFINILICTAIIWVLQTVLVSPLSAYLANWRLLRLSLPAYSKGEVSYDDLPELEKSKVDDVSLSSFIIMDVAVLSLAGLLAGLLLGFWFIGVSFDKTGWPGMAAFIALSIFGSNI
jgi:hypothetical protein